LKNWAGGESGILQYNYFKYMTLKIWSVETYGWDYGNIVGLYSTPEKARTAALEFVEKKNENYKEQYADDPDELFTLLFTEKEIGRWSNGYDYISIFEREVF
jgi:hypothetical protein